MNTTHQQKKKVLLIAEQCNPEWASVPLVAWNYFRELDQFVDITLVTHARNKAAIEKTPYREKAVYISESGLAKWYYQFVDKLVRLIFKGRTNWPLALALEYPVYAEFNHKVYQQFKSDVLAGKYDVVHALTPMMPRYPVKTVQACQNTPFILGPVNGGVPFPKGFQEKAKEEFAYFNFIRALGRYLIPGYVKTYKQATKVLVGSSYTLEMLKKVLQLPESKLELFHENGVPKQFLDSSAKTTQSDRVNLIFVGRLVPYKCADILIEAIGRLDATLQGKLSLTIVGDGSEREKLEARVEALNLNQVVQFAGWVDHQKTLEYYSQSDIFCFPSIREFGGAVVLEAMACGLPCIVANNGGIGEYVTETTGFRIDPVSREYLTEEMANKIKLLAEDEQLRSAMSTAAIARAREFEWEAKAKRIVALYEELTTAQQSAHPQPKFMEPVPNKQSQVQKNKIA